ncbi:Glycosyl transferase family 2 [Pseudovibrio axinellae]|uniref:Glycosyl transferase family 2 n=1 Tax=Pseudovibrio axinellae TaxID=989403 RepID=A0A165W081_9HYPH|nr:glycosyltransferase family 2 protein [Pseudovibrio axinellae]KZL15751.1 Glycosyl transferase family 2 [Pseudovibrio axinellae]SEQ63174.1 Glycosyltransferase involved in cell wall bisynthesis [Pseudovibrio axinellae]
MRPDISTQSKIIDIAEKRARHGARTTDECSDHKRIPLSVFIIAKNEEDRIGRTISNCIDWADEVIVIDSGSTDQTVNVAQRLGARVLHNDWPGYGLQKRFGEDQCRHDWILNLDADEVATDELKDEILDLFQTSVIASHDFWTVNIYDVWAHEETAVKHAYAYKQIRLYRKSIGRFSASAVHDTVRPPQNARLGVLKGRVEHRSIRSLAFQYDKMNRYSSMQVKEMHGRGRHLPKSRLLYEFPMAFLKGYLIRRYYQYGWWGLIASTNYATGRYMRLAKSIEADLLENTEKSRHDSTVAQRENA